MPKHGLRFGDVIEWDSASLTARWLILAASQYGYEAVWLGEPSVHPVGLPQHIGWPDREDGGWEYRLMSHE